MSDQKLRLQVLFAAVDKLTAPLKSISSASKDTTDRVNGFRKQLKELNVQQSNVDAFNRLTERARDSTEALKKARDRLAEYQDKTKQAREAQAALVGKVEAARRAHMAYVVQMAAGNDKHAGFGYQMFKAKTALEALESQFRAAQNASRNYGEKAKLAGKQVRQLKEDHRALAEPLRAAITRLKEAGVNVRQLGEHQVGLTQKINQTNAALEAQQARLKLVNERMRQATAIRARYDRAMTARNSMAGGGATMLGAGAATALPVVKAIKDYSSMEDAMLGVVKQVEGLKDAQNQINPLAYRAWSNEIKLLSESIPLATTELAKLVEMGARQGIEGRENLMNFTRQTAMMADAFGMPVEEIGERMGKIANNYQIPIAAIGQLADAINWLDDKSNAKGSEIIDVLARVGGVAGTIKITSQQTAALASTLLSLGETSETTGTAMNAIFQKFAAADKGTAAFRKAFAEIGLSTKAIQAGMQTDAIGTLQKVIAAVNKLPEQARTGVMVDLVGMEHSDTLAKLVSRSDLLKKQLAIADDKNGSGSMRQEAELRKQSLSGRQQIAENTLFNATSTLGEKLRPQLVELMEMIGRVMKSIRAWVDANPQLAATLMKTAAVAAVLLTAVGALGLAVAAVLGPLAIARLSVGKLGVQMGDKKMGGGLRVLRMLGDALKWFGSALLKLGGGFLRLRSIARVVFRFLLANPIIAIVALIAAAALYIWANWDTLGPKFKALWESIKTKAGEAWDWVKTKASEAWDSIKTKAGEAAQWMVDQLTKRWDDIKAFMSNLPSQFMTIGGQIIDGLINGISAKWGVLKDKFGSLGDALPGWLRTKLDIHSPSRVFAQIGQYTMQGLEIGIDKGQQGPLDRMLALSKHLATPLAASVALGASVIAPAAPVRIDSRPPLARNVAPVQAAPVSVNITINAAPGMDERKLAQLVAQEIAKQQRNASAAKRSRLVDAE